jgi:hypothetical protein
MESTVKFSPNVEHVNREVQEGAQHSIHVSVDIPGNYALLECHSRQALFELGRTLMYEALYGAGELELFPLIADGKALVVNGVRLTEKSSRVLVHYPRVIG